MRYKLLKLSLVSCLACKVFESDQRTADKNLSESITHEECENQTCYTVKCTFTLPNPDSKMQYTSTSAQVITTSDSTTEPKVAEEKVEVTVSIKKDQTGEVIAEITLPQGLESTQKKKINEIMQTIIKDRLTPDYKAKYGQMKDKKEWKEAMQYVDAYKAYLRRSWWFDRDIIYDNLRINTARNIIKNAIWLHQNTEEYKTLKEASIIELKNILLQPKREDLLKAHQEFRKLQNYIDFSQFTTITESKAEETAKQAIDAYNNNLMEELSQALVGFKNPDQPKTIVDSIGNAKDKQYKLSTKEITKDSSIGNAKDKQYKLSTKEITKDSWLNAILEAIEKNAKTVTWNA